MTKEDKELLIRDLSSRLPYGVKIFANNNINTLEGIHIPDGVVEFNRCLSCDIEEVKPYLFPLSSMTEEQREELFTVVLDEQVSISDCSFNDMTGYSEILTSYIIDAIDWLNKNHFDFRGLIPKGLALDATGKNIY